MRKLYSLYTQKPGDKVIELNDANGFTLVSDYPGGRDGVSIFLRLYVQNETTGGLAGSVNRVSSKEDRGGYSILDDNDPQGRVTNFSFPEDEGFILKDNLIGHSKFKESISVDDFVGFLINNHVSDKTGALRRQQFISEIWVRFIFWLVDLDFKKLKIFDLEVSVRSLRLELSRKEMTEPFLKYFYIPRNMLSISIISVSVLSIIYYVIPGCFDKFRPPEITNLLVVLYVASFFVFLEIVAERINKSIDRLDKNFKTSLGRKLASIYGFSQQKIELDFSHLSRKKK